MGAYDVLIVIGVVLLLFGGSQIPKLARSVGQAQKEYKQGKSDTGGESKVADKGSEEKKDS